MGLRRREWSAWEDATIMVLTCDRIATGCRHGARGCRDGIYGGLLRQGDDGIEWDLATAPTCGFAAVMAARAVSIAAQEPEMTLKLGSNIVPESTTRTTTSFAISH